MGLGIGIFTGDAVVGNVGNEQVMDYTVIGNTPNMAHRLQEVARAGQTLICSTTYEAIKEHFDARLLPPLNLKGKREPMEVWEVVGER